MIFDLEKLYAFYVFITYLSCVPYNLITVEYSLIDTSWKTVVEGFV